MADKLSIERVSKVRGAGAQAVEALRDVSVSVGAGEILTVLGPSGSGKSTLLRLINRLDDPSEGRILIDGEDIQSLNVLALRRRAGMIFQTAALFDGSVESNIGYAGTLVGAPVDARSLLERVGLAADFLPRDASGLSGGEQQRVAIARTLATNPEILLMDEPTSALDPTARGQIEDLVLKMNRDEGLTIVFVTHDTEQARRIGSRTMLLVAGRRVEEGPTAEFFLHPQTETARLFLAGRLTQ